MPVFDVVRVNPEGDALIAGRAPVGAEVGIYDGDKRTGTAIADSRGEWVYLPGEPLPPGQREIGLSLIGKDGTESRSESVVVLMVPDRNLAKAPVSASMPQDGTEKKSEGVLAVLVAREGNAPSRILQKPSEAQGLGDKALSIDVIDYDDKGNVSIGGKATPGTSVQVYVNNNPAAQAVLVSPDGNWQVKPEGNIGVGVHTLRVDGLSDNKVVARVEMPFSRAEPHTTADAANGIVVVQPGNSLWRIARRTLGAGVRYTEIYDANRSKIVDPDLIYPGQLFSLPDPN
ncbi:MAG: LysM peptidoglycan-binding domain-containing protein [Alphaproteobacteria bacterium]